MPEYIGNVEVPVVTPSGVFPIVPDYPYGFAQSAAIAVHQFGSANTKIEQRFLLGNGSRHFTLRCAELSNSDLSSLRDFWENQYGPYGSFTYNAPDPDSLTGTTPYTVRFENEPLSWQMLRDSISSAGITLIEIPDPASAPIYGVDTNSPLLRFPDDVLETALRSQVQQIIPIIKIQPRELDYPALYISDRRCTLDSQLYLPRLLDWDGISQSSGNESDQATFTLGNADRVMTELVNATDLYRATLEFSVFHVATGLLVNLWRGDIIDWGANSGPEFKVTAADGLYELNLPYPTRKFSRACWKDFDNGTSCPASSAYGTNLSTPCDKGFATPAGCQYHNMDNYFGGMSPSPQAVRIKDNSTGIWGYRRSSITSVSLQSESVYDQVVPEIYTNRPMKVNCKITAGREEGDFYDALGVIGEGPIGIASTGHLLDGQPHHGPSQLGLRIVPGDDPNYGPFGILAGVPTAAIPTDRAAGTAFIELRRIDEKGFQPTSLTDHEMTAIVYSGLRGSVWTTPGSRSTSAVLSNPVWIAINMLLRALGMRFATTEQCEAVFDVEAAIAAADICSDTVTALFPKTIQVWIVDSEAYTEYPDIPVPEAGHWEEQLVTDESQFEFHGTLQEEKPLRDWIQEVLMNCLGYFTFAFGKLKIGIRANSSAVESFTTGNIVFNSLALAPLKPTFNHLTANFGDEEYDFAGNSITVYDIDHAKLNGGAAFPLFLKGSMNLSGSSTKSQCARIISTRLREELGGISYAEWKAARRSSFKTTVLSLAVEPGMVCSLSHPDMPNGMLNSSIPTANYGEFRVSSWNLNKDWSIDIEGQTTTDSMYDLITGPKPADVNVSPIPTEESRAPYPLNSGLDLPILSPDPICRRRSLGIRQDYLSYADGTSSTNVVLYGNPPLSVFSTLIPAPRITGVSFFSNTSYGNIEGGHTYMFRVTARDAADDAKNSAPSNTYTVILPPGSNYSFAVTVVWPTGSYGGNLWVAIDDAKLGFFLEGGINPDTLHSIEADFGSGSATYNVLNIYNNSNGIPDLLFGHLKYRVRELIRPGIWVSPCSAVGSNTLTFPFLIGTANQWVGRVISLLANAEGGMIDRVYFANYLVTGSTVDGILTVTPDPSSSGLAGARQVGDIFTMRTIPSACSSTGFTDIDYQNSIDDTGGSLFTDSLVGKLAYIIGGVGINQPPQVIVSNTDSQINVTPGWIIPPDATSIIIIVESKSEDTVGSPMRMATYAGFNGELATIPVPNEEGFLAFVEVLTYAVTGRTALMQYARSREIYIHGVGGDMTVTNNSIPIPY